ncbi:DUF6817 domain-containing protein [Streptomyces sp. NPDC060194]|uniref:DUF6817 domain-containing protein n=1 Tax=Streptomyces sp. NPDC060194 TaxID=3347069 RepID=UPI003666FA44
MSDSATALLMAAGAETIEHPGGTLLAHLRRVHDQLGAWGGRPALRLAGLCHAFYGTEGFPAQLLPLDERTKLAAAIGEEAEEIVYFYGSCDRSASYPALTEADGVFRDRFTGECFTPSLRRRQDLAELTAANELDLARISLPFRARWGGALLELFTRFDPLLSEAARSEVKLILGA